jgi:hypothetical protein
MPNRWREQNHQGSYRSVSAQAYQYAADRSYNSSNYKNSNKEHNDNRVEYRQYGLNIQDGDSGYEEEEEGRGGGGTTAYHYQPRYIAQTNTNWNTYEGGSSYGEVNGPYNSAGTLKEQDYYSGENLPVVRGGWDDHDEYQDNYETLPSSQHRAPSRPGRGPSTDYNRITPIPRQYNPYSSYDTDVPSLVESETSSFGNNSWQDDENEYWERKVPARGNSISDMKMQGHPKFPAGTISGRHKVNNNQYNGSRTDKTITISPGVSMRLRGADETWRAIENDFYMPCECLDCKSTIFCIQDAEFVLCPECRVVSPMEDYGGGGYGATGQQQHQTGGCGLGFTMADLAKWTEDIERNRKIARKMAGSSY